MPIREFECEICGWRTERIEHTPDPMVPECPRCHKECTRILSTTNFQLRGEGWTRPSGYTLHRGKE